ncbi:MAG: DUF4139 domain-containing protein [Candidatus Diapherotrites archaeon]|uniref:DUF4139 domain-containing protein n=1 Tax=Candidatus Iainarchaeum sp. TaxID=3101447 RepID=A0A938YUR1_9ARCH|nr:DUF4139 domain-containing protein [Candidatus Diapherotrites archaeon]
MNKIMYAVGILALLAIVSAVLLTEQPQAGGPDLGTGRRVDVPSINIKEVSHVVTSEKPEAVLAQFAAEESSTEKKGTELTIYNQNFALVKEVRPLFLKAGLNLVKYQDVAAQIDPTSVLFQDMQHPDTFVVEQNYEYDLVSKAKLLQKYLDKEITVSVREGEQTKEYTGTLLSYTDGIMLQTSEGVVAVSADKIVFPELPENLWVKPTLLWKLYATQEGSRETQTTYLTDGIQWHSEYIAKVNAEDTRMDFTGWVSIDNQSGTSYPETRLKLVAGDVHRVYESKYREEYGYDMVSGAPAPEQFAEEGLFEYHMYTLGRETDVMNSQVKQISLLSSENVPVKKVFYYDGASQGTKVQTKLNFKNSEEQGMGLPLPKGKVRVYKADSGGQLQFVGEDLIDHTAKEEEVNLYLGDAFDIVGERTQTESTNISRGYYRHSYEIELRNHKDVEAEVVVHEYVGSSWKITKSSDPFEQKSSSAIEFTVKVPANGSKTVTYTVEHRYYW